MRDYESVLKSMRICLNVDRDSNCLSECFGCTYIDHDHHIMDMVRDAADAIEELQDQIAEVGKMVNELIVYAQKEADEWRASQNASYGYDRTVSVYTWANNAKCTHERYVAKLDDIAAKLPEPPKGVE